MLDIILIVILLLGCYIGYKRGFLSSVLSFLGTFIVLVIAFYLKNPVGEFLYKTFPFIEFDGILKGVNSYNILIYQSIAFLLCYIVLKILLKIVIKLTNLVETIISKIIIVGSLSKLLGIIVSLIEYGIYIYIILLIMLFIPKTNSYVNDSKVGMFILNEVPILSDVTSNLTNTVDQIYDICNDDTSNKDEKVVELLLKNKIVNQSDIDDLVKNNKIKLDDLKGE